MQFRGASASITVQIKSQQCTNTAVVSTVQNWKGGGVVKSGARGLLIRLVASGEKALNVTSRARHNRP